MATVDRGKSYNLLLRKRARACQVNQFALAYRALALVPQGLKIRSVQENAGFLRDMKIFLPLLVPRSVINYWEKGCISCGYRDYLNDRDERSSIIRRGAEQFVFVDDSAPGWSFARVQNPRCILRTSQWITFVSTSSLITATRALIEQAIFMKQFVDCSREAVPVNLGITEAF